VPGLEECGRSDDQVGDEAAEVVRYEISCFADAYTGRFLPDDPAAEHGMVAVKRGQREQLLIDVSLLPIITLGLLQYGVAADEFYVGSFAGKNSQ